ncbi:ATP-binding protein [uncultured Hymenobacter sp.]|uniref:sensor histidine kinase n=1 Tax=uncultured Hymenobacter sp. TaxID=170016 RepID=UPI0035CC6A6F
MRRLLAGLRISPWALLLVAISLLTAGYWISRLTQPLVLPRADADRLRNLVQEAKTRARREADTVAAEIRRGQLSFQQLRSRSSYPCFVYEGGQLRYWSDSSIRPDAEVVAAPVAERLVETPLGQFLTLRRAVNQFIVITYVPLERHYGISNRYLTDGAEQALFRGLGVRVVVDSAARPLAQVRTDAGSYLFSVERLVINPFTGQYVPLALLMLGAALYAASWLLLARRWWQAGRGGRAVAALVLPLLALRGLGLVGLPFSFTELPLFDPRVYAASWLAPSLGDLLLNATLAVLIAVGGLLLARHYRLLERLSSGAPRTVAGQLLAATALSAAFGGLLWLLYSYYLETFGSAQLSLDITQSMQLSGFRLVLALAVLLHTTGYVLKFYVLTQLAGAALRFAARWVILGGLALAAAVTLTLGLALDHSLLLLAALALTFGLLVRVGQLRRLPAAPGYRAVVLLALLLGLTSATGALALYVHFERQLLLDKQRLATNLLVDNDFQGEYLLGDRIRRLAQDPFVQRAFSGAFARTDAVRRRISRQYLRDYFDKYETSITLYGPAGQPLGLASPETAEGVPGQLPPPLAELRAEIRRNTTRTDQPGVFLMRSGNSFSSRRYLALTAVRDSAGQPLGTIALALTLKKLSTYSVLPELLVDQKFFQPGLATALSYGGYGGGRLVYSEGDFDYARRLPAGRLQDARLYTTGLVQGDFHHLAVRGSQGRTVVVTTTTYSLTDWLANFSFQFLMAAFAAVLLAVLYLLVWGRPGWLQLNLSSRIQLLLTGGVLVPLLVVSAAVGSQVIASYQLDLRRTYERRGQVALESLRRRPELLAGADSVAQPALAALARNVAAFTETDLNIYNARGELLTSSQPLIFEAGLLGPLLNPQAMAALAEGGQTRALLTERAGSLSFNALYLPVRGAGTAAGQAGPLTGFVGIPFFDSEKELDRKLTELFTTILNIFTLMFISFLALAFFAARRLTAPLSLVTARLTQTSLTGQNEELHYRSSDDEIGLLVREYNAMLRKLEASKQELAAQEKEAAWREMARQVAHEIKNPLTPMKLSLQYLQKAINERRPNAEELIGRISQTLITQIDVLSDIATSFSTFTNLPAMRPERLDVAAVLRRCAALHQPDAADGSLELALPLDPALDGHCIVYADENLLVRTFNNLLINARQSVPAGRVPHLRVGLCCHDHHVQVAIADNGSGIPAEVQTQMFVPNFTTKASGSGIGLAVAKRGIESAGGHIWFETQVDQGTTFFIELPLAG